MLEAELFVLDLILPYHFLKHMSVWVLKCSIKYFQGPFWHLIKNVHLEDYDPLDSSKNNILGVPATSELRSDLCHQLYLKLKVLSECDNHYTTETKA
jgi:hypothetical protein